MLWNLMMHSVFIKGTCLSRVDPEYKKRTHKIDSTLLKDSSWPTFSLKWGPVTEETLKGAELGLGDIGTSVDN